MAGPVFISYAREDSEFALRLATDLRTAGIDVWLDQLSIRAGEAWDEAIETALTSTSTLLLILSPDAIASKAVMDELAFALEEGKRVVPLLHRACRIPLRIKRLHYADFTSTYPVQELAGTLESGSAFAYEKPRAVRRRPRLKGAFATAAIGAVLGIFAILYAGNPSAGEIPLAMLAFGAFGALMWAPAGAINAGRTKRQLWSAALAILAIAISYAVEGRHDGVMIGLLLAGPMTAAATGWIMGRLE